MTVSQPASFSHDLDRLTDGAFSAPTSGERAAKVRAWLATAPSVDDMARVYKDLSARDKGAAKALKEKLDDMRRAREQEAMMADWAHKAQALLAAAKLNIADALAWQRDAAKAGAPLSKEPLAGLKQQLAERTRAIEDLQNRVQVHREAAVLLAHRIEVLSTKSLTDVEAAQETLPADVLHWQEVTAAFAVDAQWSSVDPRFPVQMEASSSQLLAVWRAFEAALRQAREAVTDAQAPLPPVPVWADEIRSRRGEDPVVHKPAREPRPKLDPAQARELQDKAGELVLEHLNKLKAHVEEGHTKAVPKIAHDLRDALKHHHRHLDATLEAQAHALLSQAGELEGWQRWRADQLREELVAKACALHETPLPGRKQQEALKQLREQWKTTDQGGTPNHALWKRFDDACNEAHKVVESWLGEVRAKSQATRNERQALMEELRQWTASNAGMDDWKIRIRELQHFSERWRSGGHLSEKTFAELAGQWKALLDQAGQPLQEARQASRQRRSEMIDQARALAAQVPLRVDAVRELQHRWQAEAQAVPLERKVEQKLWEIFRKPIDEAFQRKSLEREKQVAELNAHDQAVIQATKAVDDAVAAADPAAIRAAMTALQIVARGQQGAIKSDVSMPSVPATAIEPEPVTDDKTKPVVLPRPLVAMRGDDRPGMKKSEPSPTKPGRPGDRGQADRRPDRRDQDRRPARSERPEHVEHRGPRLGDAAFRAQRDAVDRAEQQLRKLAALAHGETLIQLMSAWAQRKAEGIPVAQQLGARVTPAQRQAWVQAVAAPGLSAAGESLLRLEMAAEVPTPAEHLNERRALQLQLLTRRNEAGPVQTWPQDVAKVLATVHDTTQERRLLACLKVLLRKNV
jgi:ATP-dependent RNA helicase SUPV3L1/SUV3